MMDATDWEVDAWFDRMWDFDRMMLEGDRYEEMEDELIRMEVEANLILD